MTRAGATCCFKQRQLSSHTVFIAAGLIGVMRDWLGLVNMSYLMVDDEPLFDEIAETVCELIFQGT